MAVEQFKALLELGHDVILLAGSESGVAVHETRHLSWVYRRSLAGLLCIRRELKRTLEVHQSDLLILHQPLTGYIVQSVFPEIAARYFFHSSWVDEATSLGRNYGVILRRYLEHRTLRRAQKVFVTSEFTHEVLTNHEPQIAQNARVVPLGVKSPPFVVDEAAGARLRDRYGIPHDNKIISVFRRLVPRTGVSLLPEVLSRCPDVTALVGGRGELEASLKRQVDDLGITSRIIFLGYVKDTEKIEILQGSDASLVPSLELEGFGLATLEALACGCPVVVTPIGNNPVLVNACNGGTIAADTTPAALGAALIDCLSKNWDKSDISKKAVAQYNWRVHAERLLE